MATLDNRADARFTSDAAPTSMSSQRFLDSKFYLLVVLGEVVSEEHLRCAADDVEKGIRSWDIDLMDCNLDQELKLFVSRHTAKFSSAVKGQKTLHHKSSVLETVVLINPTADTISTEVRMMVSDNSRHKLLVLSGQYYKNTGGLIVQAGSFSFHNFIDIFTDQEIGELLSTIHPDNRASLTIFCPEEDIWKRSNLEEHNLQDFIDVQLKTAAVLPEIEGLSEFTEYVMETMDDPSPFSLLEPPSSGGFLKLSKPCCYIFPGGCGDSTLFAVNGFNMLINGGSERKSCFWKLIRHVDRVDSILLTHLGDDNLPGINSVLQRKIAEQEMDSSQGIMGSSQSAKHLSPDLGVVFSNVPENLKDFKPNLRVRGAIEEASFLLEYLNKLSIKPEPLFRPAGNCIEPIVLFQKMGVGKLELYVLNPVENSKDLEYFLKQWSGSEQAFLPDRKGSDIPVSYLTSISSLIVWHPAAPSEKIIRVLFPGNATQQNILEGLKMVDHLNFLKQPVVTQAELSSMVQKEEKIKSKTESKESVRSTSGQSAALGLRKHSKEETLEKAKTDDIESLSGKTSKSDMKEKSAVKKDKHKIGALESQTDANLGLNPEIEGQEKSAIKTKPAKEKVHTKEVKGEDKCKLDEKLEEIKKESKRDIKRDLKKDSLLREAKREEKKELKRSEKDLKKEVRKPIRDLKKPAPASGDAKKPVSKPKVPKKEESPRRDAASPGKLKEKKVKASSSKISKAKPPDVSAGVMLESLDVGTAEVLQSEMSVMSSPEDLTKEFEELKAKGIEGYVAAITQSNKEFEGLTVPATHEAAELCKGSPETLEVAESVADVVTNDAEQEGLETMDELTSEGRIKISVNDESKDEENNLVEISEGTSPQNIENMEARTDAMHTTEKGEDEKQQKKPLVYTKEDAEIGKESSESEEEKPLEIKSDVEKPNACVIFAPQPPTGEQEISEGIVVSSEEYCPETLNPLSSAQSSPDIYSVPTGIVDMPIVEVVMSHEATWNENICPSSEFSSPPGAMLPSGHDEENSDVHADSPKSTLSKLSDVTEGNEYQPSAGTVSPPSLFEEDKSCNQVSTEPNKAKSQDTGYELSLDVSEKPTHDTKSPCSPSGSPLRKTPTSDSSLTQDLTPTTSPAPFETGITLSGSQNGMVEPSHSPDNVMNELQSSLVTVGSLLEATEQISTLPLCDIKSDFKELSENVISESVSREGMPSPLCSPPPLESVSPSDESQDAGKLSLSETSQFSARETQNGKKMSLPPSPSEDIHSDSSAPLHAKQAFLDPSALVKGSCSPGHTPEDLSEGSIKALKDLSHLSLDSTAVGTLEEEEAKKSVSEGTMSDKLVTPENEDVAEDKFSKDATDSSPERILDDFLPSLPAGFGSIQPPEVQCSASVSVVQDLTTLQKISMPLKQEFTRSDSPDLLTESPTSKSTLEYIEKYDTSLKMESPDQPTSEANMDFAKNGLTEVDVGVPFSPGPSVDEELFKNCEAQQNISPSPTKETFPSPAFSHSGFSENASLMSGANEVSEDCTWQGKTQAAHGPLSSTLSSFQDKFSAPSLTSSAGHSLLYESLFSQHKELQNYNLESPGMNVRNDALQSVSDVDLSLDNLHSKEELSPSFTNQRPLERLAADSSPDTESDSESAPAENGRKYADPPPLTIRDSPPPPPPPDVCMVEPETFADRQSPAKKSSAEKTVKKTPGSKMKSSSPAEKGRVQSTAKRVADKISASPKKKDLSGTKKKTSVNDLGKDAKNATNISASKDAKSATKGKPLDQSTAGQCLGDTSPVYLDLVYIPSHGNAKNVDAEFFKHVRSFYYVLSGSDPAAQEPSTAVLDALLEGKSQWDNNLQVTLIPTHDSAVMKEWYQQTHEKQQSLNMIVLASSSTVVMQSESFPACKIEF
ncbi:microtubule-associated protein 1B-like [Arapaima gigas]